MRLGILGCAAALTLSGAAAAQAETFLVTEPDVIVTAPGYVYSTPEPLAAPGYVVSEPAPAIVAEPPARYVVAPPVTAVVEAPLVIAPRSRVIERERVVVAPPRDRDTRRVRVAPRERVVERERVIVAPREEVVVAPRESGIITTGASSGSCFIDLNGFERCY